MITVERIGPRSYLRGTTFFAKDAIREAGGQWDLDRRAWWIADDATARDLAAKLSAAPSRADGDRERVQLDYERRHVLGRALYRGRPYYLVVEAARGRRGWIRLLYPDGSHSFFAAASATCIVERFAKPCGLRDVPPCA